MNMLTTDLFENLSASMVWPLFGETVYPWEALGRIKDFIVTLGQTLSLDEYDHPDESVWIHKTARVASSASIAGPTIICAGAEVRHCAFIRGSAFVGEGCVVGNSTELKNCVLIDHVQVPHYNYVGDSILGSYAHMGAGSICSNVKSDKTLVVVHGSEELPTGLKKFGAILGDHVEVGCNSVLCPGTVLCMGASVYPLSRVRGVVPKNSIFKAASDVVARG